MSKQGRARCELRQSRRLIGPEGGWSDREKQLFAATDLAHINIAQFTLRAETAAVVAVTQLFKDSSKTGREINVEILGSLFNFILCLGIIFGLGYVFVWFYKAAFHQGTNYGLKAAVSPYEYIMGNNIFDGASGHGIQVLLPKYLPKYILIYNDGRSNTAISYITKGQKLCSRGNFNDYFQVFCACCNKYGAYYFNSRCNGGAY